VPSHFNWTLLNSAGWRQVVSLVGHFTHRKELVVLVKWGAEWASEVVRAFLGEEKI
jgi:hypothetical protein